MIRLLIDMNLSPHWVEFLAGEGFEAIHWSVIGARDATDHALIAYAEQNSDVVMTQHLDFGAILAVTRGTKPSVVLVRAENAVPDVVGRRLVAALRQTAPELVAGVLVSIDTDRSRLRILPLLQRS